MSEPTEIPESATPGPDPPLRYAVVSTFPPTPCGIATFSAALCGGLMARGAQVEVIRVGAADAGGGPTPDGVVAHLDSEGATLAPDARWALERADVVIVQHEYGLYGGLDGESIIEVLEATDTPSIVVAHTVLGAPTPHQRQVLEAVADVAGAVVVMTEAGRARLAAGFDVDARKITVIPHGAASSASVAEGPPPVGPHLLTWGLLGPGKGIEWAIDAVGLLADLQPSPRYLIAGDTHPKVAERQGDAYRDMLRARVARAGLGEAVHFDAGYRDLAGLADLIGQSSIVVLPYDSPDQVTSGVLVDAVAAGRPVVATAFPHAQELLASGAGVVVPRCDPGALAAALRRLITDPDVLDAMAAEARRIAPGLAWPVVADQYAALGAGLLGAGLVGAGLLGAGLPGAGLPGAGLVGAGTVDERAAVPA